jgi:hypothetical protein
MHFTEEEFECAVRAAYMHRVTSIDVIEFVQPLLPAEFALFATCLHQIDGYTLSLLPTPVSDFLCQIRDEVDVTVWNEMIDAVDPDEQPSIHNDGVASADVFEDVPDTSDDDAHDESDQFDFLKHPARGG